MTDWNKLKVVDLKAELKKRGLPQTGLKPALVARLVEAEGQDGSESEDTIQDDSKHDASSAASPDTITSALPLSGLSNEVLPEPGAPQPPEEAQRELSTRAATVDTPSAGVTDDQVSQTIAIDQPPPNSTSAPEQSDSHTSALPSVEPAEAIEDRLKRKRRSQSPPPSSADVARKRFKSDAYEQSADTIVTTKDDARWVENHNAIDANTVNAEAQEVKGADTAVPEPTIVDISKGEVLVEPALVSNEDSMEVDGATNVETSEHQDDTTTKARDARYTNLFSHATNVSHTDATDSIDYEIDREIKPAIHPATSALYIKNFMRPLQASQLQSHLAMLATAPGGETDPDVIVNFYLDPVKTHAFIVFSNTSAASRVRNAFHDRIWPDEKTRKPLWVDFVPVEKAEEWIAEEMATNTGHRSSQKKWEVDYRIDEDRNVTAILREADRPIQPVRQPIGPSSTQAAAPRPAARPFDPPLGPRGFKPATNLKRLDQLFKATTTAPVLYYQPVHSSLANKRLDTIDKSLSKDAAAGRRITGDIHRYTFEDGDELVDRGPEIFSGIRPPPGFRGPRGGRGGFRPPPGSDRDRIGRDSGWKSEGRARYDSWRSRDLRDSRDTGRL